METLTKSEERVMQILWGLKKAFVKDIIADMEDEPKPSYTTVSTIIRILEKKEFVSHKAYGKTHEYFPLVNKFAYRKFIFSKLFSDYFEGSYGNVVSYLVNEEKLSEKEIQELNQIINENDQKDTNDKQ